jgi:hypothetical protein
LRFSNMPAGVDPLGDEQRVVAAFPPRVAGVDGAHLLGALQVVARAFELERRVRHGGRGLHAQQCGVRVPFRLVGVMRVVGDDERHVEPARDVDQAVPDPALDLDAVVHDFAEVVLVAEDVLVGGGRFEGGVEMAQPQAGSAPPRTGTRWSP